MRIFVYSVVFIFGSWQSFAQKKQVCFSIDDLPVVNYGVSDTVFQKTLMEKLIQALTKNKIPAIGFVNETKLFDHNQPISSQIGLLNEWVDSGLELGNHTFSHPDYNVMSLNEYSQNILKGELVTSELLKRKGTSLQYFRHPFLHVGNSKEKCDSLNFFLLNHGYTVVPVTIDNEDYLFALAYRRANDKYDRSLMNKIGADYIDYMEKKLVYFEKQAFHLFGREINQILLLHASLLNADYVDAMAKMFRKNGYHFITMDKALEDDAYKTAVTRFGDWGISWIDRWALSAGKSGDFFKGDPVTPAYIKKLSE